MTTRLCFLRRITTGLAVAALAMVTLGATAQQPSPETVVATLNGEPITRADLALAAAEFGDQLAQVAPGREEAALIDLVINMRLAGRAAEAEGVEGDPAVVRRLAFARDRTLYSEYLRTKFIAAVTEEAVQQRFDEELAAFEPQTEVRARHILVPTEDEANAIVEQLADGADFATLAAELSQDPGSGRSGGDLGFFKRGAMVKPFEDAAFKLKAGKYTKKPVQTDFGWHVILVEDRRKEPAPTFDAEAQRIQQVLIRETIDAEIEALRAAATIEIGAPAPQTD
ncbi:peptidylprolyl isomerase [Bauldia sp.]|uniref:peptidylprolyl isomerase n=1 Tax=Bauldia sp. TaxID=2575872 RepID=UPI003BAC2A3F